MFCTHVLSFIENLTEIGGQCDQFMSHAECLNSYLSHLVCGIDWFGCWRHCRGAEKCCPEKNGHAGVCGNSLSTDLGGTRDINDALCDNKLRKALIR